MRTRLTLRPGQPGTRRLQAEHGDRLVCVRYRYDKNTCKRLKTVELIVEESAWDPEKRDDDAIVPVQVGFQERDLRDLVKSAGGRWDREKRAWKLRYDQVTKLGLIDRIVREAI